MINDSNTILAQKEKNETSIETLEKELEMAAITINEQQRINDELKKAYSMLMHQQLQTEKEQIKLMVNEYDDRFIFFEKDEKTGKLKVVYDHVGHANSLMQEYKLMRLKNNSFFYYNSEQGIWKEDAESHIKNVITNRQGQYAKEHWLRQCYTNLYHRSYDNESTIDFDEDPFLVNVANGVVNIKTGEFLPFNLNYYHRIKIPHNYVPNAECPKIHKFIVDVVGKEQARFIYELIGYCLIKNYDLRKIVIFYGKGKNGKSKMISLIEIILGKANVSNVSLHDLQTHKFATAELDGKSANTFADIEGGYFGSVDKLKALSGGDYMMVEHKNGKPYSMKNHAKIIASANELPTFKEKTDAIKDRFIILPFTKRFKEGNDNIINEIATKEELEGLLFHSIEAIRHVFETGQFSITTKIERATNTWLEEMDNIRCFVQDCCVIELDAFVINSDLYDAYKKYCFDCNYKAEGKKTFYKNLKASYPEIFEKEGKNANRKTVTFFRNIGLK